MNARKDENGGPPHALECGDTYWLSKNALGEVVLAFECVEGEGGEIFLQPAEARALARELDQLGASLEGS